MKITLLTGKIYDIKDELGFDIKVVPSRSARRLILRIDSKERIPVLSVPRFCSRRKAVDFVNEHRGWIMTALAKIPQTKKLENGDKLLLFGQRVEISHQEKARCGVRLEGDKLIVSGGAEFLHRRVKDYIKREAQKRFYEQSQKLAAKIGKKLIGVSIKDTKSRWGSCSSLNHINYSWRIALAPREVIDYLLAHEVAHLAHQDHSDAFWDCVNFLNPNWKSGHDWLKKYGKSLYYLE